MSKALILFCHPEPKSFNGTLRDATVKFLEDRKFEVKIVDLTQSKFNAVGGSHDFTKLKNPDLFDYQGEQKYAVENECFSPDVKEQMDLLTWCDQLFLIFPFYWFNVPANLKGWFDRVLAYYYAYGGDSQVGGKLFYACTTGGRREWYKKGGLWDRPVEDYLANIWAVAKLTKMELMTPFIANGINFMKPEEKEGVLSDYKKHLESVFK